MISEPELVGGDGDAPIPPPYGPPPYGPTPPAGDAPAEDLPGGGGERRARPPWLWALGGVLVSSALWAGGLYAYQAMGPSLGGYRTSDNLCDAADLPALRAKYGERAEGTDEGQNRHEALDQALCSVTLSAAGDDDGPGYGIDVTYDLHKVTDPGPEFEPFATGSGWDGWDWKPVEGLGERALFAQDDEGYAALRVLDGQAVLSMMFSVQAEYDPDQEDPPPGPDASATRGVKDLMVKDMRTLMAELKR
ncbi:hypothetical protein [Streptomyces ficellus]|uniref:DUF3558 domain-containing protein n=1 Tax=Streptomyces ficellus TaxID=1977088 RepID=A0A6I6F762_9ACTN|nr:hypothetical protein [Streptomyces ficellus]QGV78801.1 hypothetical protein EIZ62_11490 [Streptomyces ficellus]